MARFTVPEPGRARCIKEPAKRRGRGGLAIGGPSPFPPSWTPWARVLRAGRERHQSPPKGLFHRFPRNPRGKNPGTKNGVHKSPAKAANNALNNAPAFLRSFFPPLLPPPPMKHKQPKKTLTPLGRTEKCGEKTPHKKIKH
eukprot:FR740762.1.p1 GENE.FR740762.1~~FR740762.1.p1  ORF type:complete len:141 (+),score=37.89 FR740762.1:836-1258(+)